MRYGKYRFPSILHGKPPPPEDFPNRLLTLIRRGDWMNLGGGANHLIASSLTDMGTGAAYYDRYVRLENGSS